VHDEAKITSHSTPARQRTAIVVATVILILLGTVSVLMLWSRRATTTANDAGRRSRDVVRGVTVRTAIVSPSSAVRKLDLLGEARPYSTVTLYAKVGGYLKTVPVDVGDRVAAGAVLATIESPETDRALLSADADFQNKRVTADRIAQLLQRKLVSPQEADQARTDAAMAEQRLEGLREQQGYETLRAPFAGTITARFADPGALVQSAATSQTSALPVVTVSETARLRVLIYLDQADAGAARPGTPAVVTLSDRPDIRISARIARVSEELDPKTRKMLAEVDLDNRGGPIVAGSFVQVEIAFPNVQRPQAPAEALLIRSGQTFVGIVDAQSRVHLQPVVVADNDGRRVSFAGGIVNGDRVALNLGSAVADGDRVQVAPDSSVTLAAHVPAPADAPPQRSGRARTP
jgi:RND family efflux transporter MFP subunit